MTLITSRASCDAKNTNTRKKTNIKTTTKIAWMANYLKSHVAGNSDVNVFFGPHLVMNTKTNENKNTKTKKKTQTAWMANYPTSHETGNSDNNF